MDKFIEACQVGILFFLDRMGLEATKKLKGQREMGQGNLDNLAVESRMQTQTIYYIQ